MSPTPRTNSCPRCRTPNPTPKTSLPYHLRCSIRHTLVLAPVPTHTSTSLSRPNSLADLDVQVHILKKLYLGEDVQECSACEAREMARRREEIRGRLDGFERGKVLSVERWMGIF